MKEITRYRDLEHKLAEDIKFRMNKLMSDDDRKINHNDSKHLIGSTIAMHKKEISAYALDILANDSQLHKENVAALLEENINKKFTIHDIVIKAIEKNIRKDLEIYIIEYMERDPTKLVTEFYLGY